MLIQNDEFKKVFILEWSDFTEKLGKYFLEIMNETNVEILEDMTTLNINSQFRVYVGNILKVNSEKFYSLVNTYNIIRFGNLKTYSPPTEEG